MDSLTLRELQAIARSLKIKYYAKYRKSELAEKLRITLSEDLDMQEQDTEDDGPAAGWDDNNHQQNEETEQALEAAAVSALSSDMKMEQDVQNLEGPQPGSEAHPSDDEGPPLGWDSKSQPEPKLQVELPPTPPSGHMETEDVQEDAQNDDHLLSQLQALTSQLYELLASDMQVEQHDSEDEGPPPGWDSKCLPKPESQLTRPTTPQSDTKMMDVQQDAQNEEVPEPRSQAHPSPPPEVIPSDVEVMGTSISNPEKQHEMKQTRNWLDLPSDVMVNILSRVSAIELLWNVQIVCTKWHKICKDRRMWRVIYIELDFYSYQRPYTWPSCLPSSGISSKATVELCKQAVDRSEGQLVDISMIAFSMLLIVYGGLVLSLKSSDLFLNVSLPILNRSSEPRRLEIAYSYEEGLPKALKKLKKLEELSLFKVAINQKDIEALGCYCPMLKTLKFNDCRNDGLTGDELAMAIVENLPELKHLELTQHFLSESMLRTILDGCRHLEVLDLRMCGPLVLEGELKQRCLEQIRSLKLPTDPLKLDPYSEDGQIVDLETESWNIWEYA